MCNTLSNAAHLKVDDVQNGVTITMTPKGDTDLPTLRDDARRIQGALHVGPGREATGAEAMRALSARPAAGRAHPARRQDATRRSW